MNHDDESLLEVDRIEEVLEAADQPQPVVVIQYPKKGLSWFWIMAFIILTPIGGLLIYHRLVVERLRSQNLAAKRELESWKERIRLEAARQELVPAERGIPLSSNSPQAVPVPVITVPSRVQASATSDSGTGKGSPIAKSADVTTDRGRSPSVDGVVVRETESTPPAPFTGDSPARALDSSPPMLGSPAVATAPAQDLKSPFDEPLPAADDRPPATAGSSTTATLPRAEVPDALTRASTKEPEHSPAPSVAPPSPPAAVNAERPLPSKEETLRAIQEEALQKQEEIRRQVMDKAVETHRLRYEERIRFHEDLKEVLDQNGLHAGAAIDQLCTRYGYEADRVRIARGSRLWSASVKHPLVFRAGLIRAFGLPETAILNFLSDDLHARLRTPNGPRNSNEVRVKAAKMLLKCELPPFDEVVRSLAAASRGAPDANRPPGTPSSKDAAVARPR